MFRVQVWIRDNLGRLLSNTWRYYPTEYAMRKGFDNTIIDFEHKYPNSEDGICWEWDDMRIVSKITPCNSNGVRLMYTFVRFEEKDA